MLRPVVTKALLAAIDDDVFVRDIQRATAGAVLERHNRDCSKAIKQDSHVVIDEIIRRRLQARCDERLWHQRGVWLLDVDDGGFQPDFLQLA